MMRRIVWRLPSRCSGCRLYLPLHSRNTVKGVFPWSALAFGVSATSFSLGVSDTDLQESQVKATNETIRERGSMRKLRHCGRSQRTSFSISSIQASSDGTHGLKRKITQQIPQKRRKLYKPPLTGPANRKTWNAQWRRFLVALGWGQ